MKRIKLYGSIFMAVLLVAFSFPVGVYAEESEITETHDFVVNEEQETENAVNIEDESCETGDSNVEQDGNLVSEEIDTIYSTDFFSCLQLVGVNGAVNSALKPHITDISLDKSQVKIMFSQYMKPETVKNVVLKNEKGISVGYTLEYPEDEKDSNDKVIAKEFTFILKSESIIFSMSIPDSIKNYEGTSVTKGMNVKGVIKSYNPKIKTTVSLVHGTEVFATCTIEPTESWAEGCGEGFEQGTQKFVFGGVPAGKYDLVVTKDGHLTYTVKNVVIKDRDVNLSEYVRDYQTMNMIVGDLNGDTNVNSLDWGILWKNSNYMKSTEEAVDKLADINGDGNVNASDWSILWNDKNYMKGVSDTTFEYVAPYSPPETEIDPF